LEINEKLAYSAWIEKLAAPPGFEPEISASKADVLPLHYGATKEGRLIDMAAQLILKSQHRAVKAAEY
jgi:hypothetical protein